ncbi:MAG: hypothetical protein WD824_23220 [Cyclobacteriaceae bacterium]
MVYFSHTVIIKIKAAADDKILIEIVSAAIQDLQKNRRNAFNSKRGFILNMIMALKYLKAEGVIIQERDNITKAIKIFESLQKHEPENLF